MRILIVIPIIHTQHDMGSLHELSRQEYVNRYGDEKWAGHVKSIEQVWRGIRQMIDALELPFARVRIYQDGLPLCGNEADIVREVAGQGSLNHQILVELMAQGAHLMGTEDPTLLLQEYHLQQGTLSEAEKVHKGQSELLLSARDQFIAERINSTLMAGEVGLLFLGMAHQVEPRLNTDILVRDLLPSLREKQEEIQCLV